MASFGENLRQAREAHNITLPEIAASTKISTRALQALENERFDQLPGGIFNRGFVRAYARYVGLDEEKTVAEYLAAAKVPPPELDMQVMSTQVIAAGEARPWAPNAASVVGVLAVIVALGLGALWLREQRKEAREQTARHQAEALLNAAPPASASAPATGAASQPNLPPQSAANGGEPDPSQKPNPSTGQTAASVTVPGAPVVAAASPAVAGAPPGLPTPVAASQATAPVEVSIAATARSWISVQSDGRKVETLTLDPAKPQLQTRSYTAKQKLILEVGNPGALTVTYNGKPTGTLGSSGQRETITFTPEGMEKH